MDELKTSSSAVCFARQRRALVTNGIVFFESVAFEDFIEFMRALGTFYVHPDADPDGITRIVPDGRRGQSGGGFTMNALAPHTDRATTDSPPQFLGTYFMRRDSGHGGDPTFCHLGMALKTIPETALRSLTLKERGGDREYPVSLGNWDNYDRFRFRDDSYYVLNGPRRFVEEVRTRVSAMTYSAPSMVMGDAYVLDNTRVLHGRTSFDDPNRAVARILISAEGGK